MVVSKTLRTTNQWSEGGNSDFFINVLPNPQLARSWFLPTLDTVLQVKPFSPNSGQNVTLSAAGTQPITINYATANGTATARVDYQATSGTLTFAPGETTKTVNVTINGDTVKEANETVLLNFSSPATARFR